jgi:hypothetical protein
MTSTVEIVETEDLGDVTKIVVMITSAEVCSVHDTECDYIDRATSYHASLHNNRVAHSHNNLKIRRALFFDNPYTQEDVDTHINILKQELENVNYEDDFYVTPHDVLERQYTDAGHEKIFHYIKNLPQSLVSQFEAVFPNIDITAHSLVSTPVFHELLGEEVISAFLWEHHEIGERGELIMRGRKYCMNSKKYYDRCYKASEERFDFLPPEATTIAVGYNTNAQDGLELPDFFEVYFSCDPTIAETFFELDSLQGEHATYYAVTVVNNTVVRAKQYCYDKPNMLSNWEKAVAAHKAESA